MNTKITAPENGPGSFSKKICLILCIVQDVPCGLLLGGDRRADAGGAQGEHRGRRNSARNVDM